MEELKKASAGTDVAAINQAMEGLTKAQHAAAETLYKQAQSGGGGAEPAGGASAGQSSAESSGGKQGDVIDAEVVDEK